MLLISCDSSKDESNCENSSKTLTELIKTYEDHEGYDETEYPLGLYTKEFYAAEAEFAKQQLSSFDCIQENELTETEQISASLLKFVLQEKIDFVEYEQYLNPLLSDSGFHNNLPYEVRNITNPKEAKDYLNKLKAIPEYVDQHIALLREGLEKGISQPRVIFNGYESSYDDHIVDEAEDSFYYSPFKNLPTSIEKEQQDSIIEAAKAIVAEDVVPQFKKIKAFFEAEYLPNTRTTLGVSETPRGKEYYQNRINYYSTLNYTADEIHELGLKEVARIRAEMEAIIKGVEFKGSFKEFLSFLRTDTQFYAKSPNELLMKARDISKRVDAQLPRFFKTLPRQPYGVAAVPDAIAPKYTGGRYIPADIKGTSPGYYWVNTYNLPSRPLYVLPSLTVHEAVPGHHLQIALNAELGDSIPKFRRNLYLSAYGEGWGLYTEFLANEFGIYSTPYENFGKLTYEMWRACRLVVDTGIHAKGWTRDQVVEFMSSNTALSIHEVNTETDRYISWPGQALSYKIGELKIRELRLKSENELKEKFDIREFHEIILEQGTVTLPILERRVNTYIEANK
ncbi:DUF885 family protein [Spongiivirga citrea]|uniref:DUF885 family protein n=2 Tax=Spongiivirga citrea TaxID=1481457 RepID=A0A6M0CT74_9FLAO|nr:DUF885 domain-containing protein [Spongiivirga citrea]NER19139.1 DUF885 family protein [Spongiivirga citrea]